MFLLPSFNFITKYKFLLFLIFILRYPINKNDQNISKLLEQLRQDIEFCPQCFTTNITIKNCNKIFKNIIFDDNNFFESLNNLFGVKSIRYGNWKIPKSPNTNQKIVIKYLGNQEKFNYILGGISTNDTKKIQINYDENIILKKLENLFFNKNRIDGLQFCPKNHIENFIDLFTSTDNNETNEISIESKLNIWINLIVNSQILLLPKLKSFEFSIPQIYGICGFTIIQTYEGKSLIEIYKNFSFNLKLQITKQLFESIFKFTNGYLGYRLYLTDLNLDNIVYNIETKKISFIDLDNIIIVDSLYLNRTRKINNKIKEEYYNNNEISYSNWFNIHKHEIINCNGCFAYVPTDICSYHKSDINLYAICQLLREDLYGNQKNGFLYPIPENFLKKYPNFMNLLNECVECKGKCKNRFESATYLLKLLKEIVK